MPQHHPVLLAQPRKRHHRALEGGIQHNQAALILGLFNPERLCWPLLPQKTSDDYHTVWTENKEQVSMTLHFGDWP